MATATSVPLMSDIEGGGGTEERQPKSDIKNDFSYHNNVAGAPALIRKGFLKKVYGLLSLQLTMTTLIAAVCMATPQIKEGVQSHPGFLLAAFVSSFAILIALFVKRRESPINLILLAAFTIVESYTIGVLVSFYDVAVVLQAFFLTAGVVVGLTVFAFQTKKDFTHWGTGLFAGLWILILGGFMQIFVGGEVTDTLMAVFGALLFSGFILFDTQMIMKRVSPEEYIVATIELYLDIINLFIEILKIIEKVNRK